MYGVCVCVCVHLKALVNRALLPQAVTPSGLSTKGVVIALALRKWCQCTGALSYSKMLLCSSAQGRLFWWLAPFCFGRRHRGGDPTIVNG